MSNQEVLEPVYWEKGIAGLFAWCEGCDSRHYIPIVAGYNGVKWEWNGDCVAPTFSPSILIYEHKDHQPRCHSFIRQGVWEYLTDCTHQFAGLNRPLLTVEKWPEE